MYVKNYSSLTKTGYVYGRKVLLDLLNQGLDNVDPYSITKQNINLKNDLLTIFGKTFDLTNFNNIYVIGAGKATINIAKALDKILDNRVKDGIIIVKYGQFTKLNNIKVFEADHPVPNQSGFDSTVKIVNLLKKTRKDDLLICIFTGGCSSLMTYPYEHIGLKDKQQITKILLNSGAEIFEINTIRKHISMVKGGKLLSLFNGDVIINLTISDIIGNDFSYCTGPTVIDKSTFDDVDSILNKYDLLSKIPISIKKHLNNRLPEHETVKSTNISVNSFLLLDNKQLCENINLICKSNGLNSLILSSEIDGETKDLVKPLYGIIKNIIHYDEPIKKPCVIISGGESTVSLDKKHGLGGPNQEFAVSFALNMNKNDKIALLSVGSDGTDGPTNIAGGLVDHFTVDKALKLKVNIPKELINHNSSNILSVLKDEVITGHTNNNVMDLRLFYIGA